ncbi:hypothetical protein [Ruminobacter amylophilus]|uniref:hypothetical protein n=1 Tax=Ruminobacter amylophilus TaxID=867 RepID=UPI00386F688D
MFYSISIFEVLLVNLIGVADKWPVLIDIATILRRQMNTSAVTPIQLWKDLSNDSTAIRTAPRTLNRHK